MESDAAAEAGATSSCGHLALSIISSGLIWKRQPHMRFKANDAHRV